VGRPRNDLSVSLHCWKLYVISASFVAHVSTEKLSIS
jgi:hypothetical protein